MAKDITILIGTAGQGVMRSADGGGAWRRVGITQGIHSDAVVRCLTPVPGADDASVLAGCDRGILRSDDRGETWRRLDTPMNDTAVWAIAFDPADPQTAFAGTGTPDPCRIYRTRDGGASWELRPVDVAAECPAVGVPRVTGIAVDPANSRSVWVGIEVDGLRHSSDGGDTWATVPHADIPNLDIHNVAVTAGPPHRVVVMVNDDVFLSDDDGGSWRNLDVRRNFPLGYPRGIRVKPDAPQTIYTTFGDIPNLDIHNVAVTAGPPHRVVVMVNDDVFLSDDDGGSWRNLDVRRNFPLGYPRGIRVKPDAPQTIYTTFGDTTPGITGVVMRSDDAGATWQNLPLPVAPNTAMWVVNSQPQNPDYLLAGSRYGYLYQSGDAGATWAKFDREFSEISSAIWFPN